MASGSSTSLPQQRQPNVLLICVDHWSGQLTRPAGHPVVMTPTIEQLTRNGVCFSNAYSTCPTCIPARRSIMTGLSSRNHGDRTFREFEPMPRAETLAQCFRDAGYQAYAVGKLHVYPQRDRIGFDEVILNEEGRHHLGGGSDDWEHYLADCGYAGQEYAGGLCNNDYITRPWHLPEDCHPTNWATAQMCRTIARRDPTRPAFWYLSYVGPHQPVWPLRDYMDLYRDVPMDPPIFGDWSRTFDQLPWMLRTHSSRFAIQGAPAHEVELARRAFYATITHIDHQIRVVIGTLREQKLLDDTIIAFTSDHGDMLGDHHLWTKAVMYERSMKVPMIFIPRAGDTRWTAGTTDDRLVCLEDLMPTLLDLAGLPCPDGIDGASLLKGERRECLYGEHYEAAKATRMVRDLRYKLVYFATGNCFQLFDLDEDPRETRNLIDESGLAPVRQRLTELLIASLYGGDTAWLRGGKLVGLPDQSFHPQPERGLVGQRGLRFL